MTGTTAHNQQQDMRTSVLRWLLMGARQNMAMCFLISAIMLSAIAIVLVSFESRLAFQDLQQQLEMKNDMEVKWGQLLIEQSTFGVDDRIERKASQELGMKVPDWSNVVVVKP
jgi:cell division protein FtsL